MWAWLPDARWCSTLPHSHWQGAYLSRAGLESGALSALC